MAIRIDRLGPGDEEAGLALVRAFSGRLKKKKPKPDPVRDFLKNNRNYLLGAYVNDQPVGFAVAYQLVRPDGEKDMLFLYEIEVAEDHRREGVGAELLEALKRWRLGKLFVLTNASNEAGMQLYASVGGERPNSDDVLFTF